ncbi:MLP protein [Melia azedarach]|uniref:MLP protein n=1 Tax=Melia azedarach TaxID=155640 RepID=A0ACC1XGW4_MELAZ|nr:MLP protein [Melia azedarach]
MLQMRRRGGRSMLSLTGEVSANVEVQAPAAMTHEVFSSKLNQLSNACPEKVKAVDLLEGEWGKAGCVICWHFVYDGKTQTCKEVMEEIDFENKKTTYKVVEGNLLENYRSFYFMLQVTPKGEGSLVNWTLKYEKMNHDVPEPNAMLQFAVDVTKDIVANLVPQA